MPSKCTLIGTCKGFKIGGFILAILALSAIMVAISVPGLFGSAGEDGKIIVDKALQNTFIMVSAVTTAVGSLTGAISGTVQKSKEYGKEKADARSWPFRTPTKKGKVGSVFCYWIFAASIVFAAFYFWLLPQTDIKTGNLKLMLLPTIVGSIGMGSLLLWGGYGCFVGFKSWKAARQQALDLPFVEDFGQDLQDDGFGYQTPTQNTPKKHTPKKLKEERLTDVFDSMDNAHVMRIQVKGDKPPTPEDQRLRRRRLAERLNKMLAL